MTLRTNRRAGFTLVELVAVVALLELNLTPITPSKALQCFPSLYKLRYPTFLHGDPGIGKSSIVRQFAKRRQLRLIDLRLSTIEAIDLRGLPTIDRDKAETVWIKPEFLPTDESPGILFLDEFTAVEERMQAACLELLLDRRIGKHQIGPNWWIVAAGNLASDGVIIYEMTTTTASRLVHLHVAADVGDWLEWAETNRLHFDVLAYLRAHPQQLTTTEQQSETGHVVGATPRGWERVSEILKENQDSEIRRVLVEGVVGREVANSFFLSVSELSLLPQIDNLMLQTPERAAAMVPSQVEALYGLCYGLPACCHSLEDLLHGLAVWTAITSVQDTLPREEIQTLAVELLLQRAAKLQLFYEFTQHADYSEYLRTRHQPLKPWAAHELRETSIFTDAPTATVA
ncbi:MAG: AAA family ATPase [Verrucomicrobia subdivision 3 bacterium]|nr:AAA family ATPase [Limisphaerales bacterium]